ncbi:MAG: leucine-rich repeat domain-containing protein [Lachnospiraceae bacterium]|nr:leucine-rich repeat domain-containing protein [Lachnospiraceae bacterium]
MKNRKKYLLFTLFTLGIFAAGINGQPVERDTASIANAAETGFIINDDGILTGYNGTDTRVVIPDEVTGINDWVFSGRKKLTSVIIPDGVTSIGDGAFSGCKKLTSITIPEKTTVLGYNVFKGCTSLKEIKVKKGNEKYQSEDGVLFKKVKSGTELVTYPAAKSGKTYKVPAKTSSIASGAFADCGKLTGIVLPASLKKIEYKNGSFFSFAGLKNIKINMKKGQTINMSFVIDEDSEAGPAIPTITVKNKNIINAKMPSDWKNKNSGDIDYIEARTFKGSVKAKKKGKAEIIVKREVAGQKQINDKEFVLENKELKTTVVVNVK